MRIQSCKQPAYSHNRLALNCISNVTRASAIQNDIPMRSDYIEGVPTSPITLRPYTMIRRSFPFVQLRRNRVEDIQGTKITKSRKWRNNYLQ